MGDNNTVAHTELRLHLQQWQRFIVCTSRQELYLLLVKERWQNFAYLRLTGTITQSPPTFHDYFGNIRSGFSKESDSILTNCCNLKLFGCPPWYLSLRQTPPTVQVTDQKMQVVQPLLKQHIDELESLLDSERTDDTKNLIVDIGYLYYCILPHLYWLLQLVYAGVVSENYYSDVFTRFWRVWVRLDQCYILHCDHPFKNANKEYLEACSNKTNRFVHCC